jgi:hypothetical protein
VEYLAIHGGDGYIAGCRPSGCTAIPPLPALRGNQLDPAADHRPRGPAGRSRPGPLIIPLAPLPRPPGPARCQAIGGFFEASDADVVCFQEVHTYYHLRQLARQMPSFRYASFRRTLPGPAGDVVTFSRLPMSVTAYHGSGPSPHAPGIPSLTLFKARTKGALVTSLADPAISVINTHLVANTDGDWSPTNRFSPVHRAQLVALARVVRSAPVPAVVCGDFNVDRDSALFGEFIAGAALDDAFEGSCPATFRAEQCQELKGSSLARLTLVVSGPKVRRDRRRG